MQTAVFSASQSRFNNKLMLNVGGITPFTTIDFPGCIAAVIFCQGCSWCCSYCHNQHLLSVQKDAPVPWEQVMEFLESRKELLDGIVFSGGEPTIQPALPEAMQVVRDYGYKVGLHTSGAYPGTLEKCLPLLDWVGMDLKAPFEDYEQITGVVGSGELARKSAELVRYSGVAHLFRTTLDPFVQQNGRLEKMQQMVWEWGSGLVLQEIR